MSGAIIVGQPCGQPGAGEGPVIPNGPLADAQRFADFRLFEPAEKRHLKHVGGAGPLPAELVDGVVQFDQNVWLPDRFLAKLFERDFRPSAAPFAPAVSAGVLNQNAPNRPRSGNSELPGVLKVGAGLADAKINLVREGRWLKRVVVSFVPHRQGTQRPKFVVQERW